MAWKNECYDGFRLVVQTHMGLISVETFCHTREILPTHVCKSFT